jgi:hypothetical protein
MQLQKVKIIRENDFFAVLKVTDENSRVRIRSSEVHTTGSVLKCHGSATLSTSGRVVLNITTKVFHRKLDKNEMFFGGNELFLCV